jgi:hypothetical protein
MSAPLLHMPRPCDATDTSGPCPFRVDAPAGEFPASRYEKLADTAGLPGAEVPVGGPMFACHHTRDGAPVACAGWLAVCGDQHLGVRMALAEGRIEPEAVRRPVGGPELFESYDVMAREQADGVYDPDRAAASREAAGHNLPLVQRWTYGISRPACSTNADGDGGDLVAGTADLRRASWVNTPGRQR